MANSEADSKRTRFEYRECFVCQAAIKLEDNVRIAANPAALIEPAFIHASCFNYYRKNVNPILTEEDITEIING